MDQKIITYDGGGGIDEDIWIGGNGGEAIADNSSDVEAAAAAPSLSSLLELILFFLTWLWPRIRSDFCILCIRSLRSANRKYVAVMWLYSFRSNDLQKSNNS